MQCHYMVLRSTFIVAFMVYGFLISHGSTIILLQLLGAASWIEIKPSPELWWIVNVDMGWQRGVMEFWQGFYGINAN